MPDPYAYIPLSGKIVGSKKKSAELNKDFKDIIKSTKTGGEIQARKMEGRVVGKGIKKSNKKHK